MDYLYEISISGCWGPTAIMQDDSYGGEHCAYKDGNSVAYRFGVILLMVSQSPKQQNLLILCDSVVTLPSVHNQAGSQKT
jgi:hypothetical protein